MTTHYGIIGCGMMGQEHLRNIALLEDAFVKVIYEPDPEMAARALQLAPRAVLAENIDSLLAHDQLDCLLIASPNFCHVDQLEAIAARVSCAPNLATRAITSPLTGLSTSMVEPSLASTQAPLIKDWVLKRP